MSTRMRRRRRGFRPLQKEDKMSNYRYFTFGSEGQVHYRGYIKIKADTLKEAQQKFIARYGAQAWSGNCLRYAFDYTQQDFDTLEQFRSGDWAICHEVIE